MSYSHLINCIMLSFGPYFVCYRAKNMSDFNAFRVCLAAAVAYLLTTVCKMILLATVLSTEHDSHTFDLVSETNKNFFNLIDCVGIFALLQYRFSFMDKPNVRAWAITIGWGLCESICTNFFYFILHATGEEFSWKYISKALVCNLEILETYCVVVLLLYVARSHRRQESVLHPKNILAYIGLFAKSVGFATFTNYLIHKNAEDEINTELIASKAVFAMAFWAFTGVFGFNK
mmetsp:Transcript_14723/g.16912  ORF Transcript_14723/g.16912 Transcript_14723/m.16912 type:complete len:232 (-) Transcript_14723:120-815(-)